MDSGNRIPEYADGECCYFRWLWITGWLRLHNTHQQTRHVPAEVRETHEGHSEMFKQGTSTNMHRHANKSWSWKWNCEETCTSVHRHWNAAALILKVFASTRAQSSVPVHAAYHDAHWGLTGWQLFKREIQGTAGHTAFIVPFMDWVTSDELSITSFSEMLSFSAHYSLPDV